MSRFTSVLLSVLAVLVGGNIASSTALAAEEETCGAGLVVALCFPGAGVLHEAAKGFYPFSAKKGSGDGEALIEAASLTIHIACTEENAIGKFEQPAELLGDVSGDNIVIDYHGCTILPPLECSLGLPVELGLLVTNQLTTVADVSEPDEVTIFPPANGIFAELIMSGENCTQAGTFKLTGTQLAKWDNLDDSKTHLLTAGPTSGLKFGGKTVTEFLNELTVELLSSKEFDFDLI
jgi:hypothetical protein